jgi:hypothetical protein
MQTPSDLIADRQFSLAYLLSEIALVAVALAAGRVAIDLATGWLELRAVLFCVATTAACGAAGGLFFRMAMGLIGGGIFSVLSIPLVCLALSAISR